MGFPGVIMNRLWSVVGLAAALGAAPAQAAELSSVDTWGGPASELVEGTAVAADGSVYVAGTTFSFGSDADVFLLKYDEAGNLLWQRRWAQQGPFLNDNAGDVAVDGAGAAYVVGTTVAGANGNDLLLLKFDAAGTLVWQRTWGGGSLDEGQAVAVDAEGNVYAVGTTQSFNDREAFILKFAPDGTLLWQRTWSRGDSDSAQAVTIGPDGNVYVGATSFRPIFLFDAAVLKLSPAGELLAEAGYAVSEIADALGIAVAGDGSVYVAGSLDGADAAFVVRFDADLTLDWQRSLGGRSGDRANAVTVAPDGTVWVVGETNTADASDEAFIAQLSPDRGRVLQQSTWGGVEIEQGIDLGFGPDGILNVGAIAQAPPWTFRRSRLKDSRLRGDSIVLDGTLSPVTGTVGTPSGVVTSGEGSEQFAGESDSALLRITP